jgi:hypothetical protein
MNKEKSNDEEEIHFVKELVTEAFDVIIRLYEKTFRNLAKR